MQEAGTLMYEQLLKAQGPEVYIYLLGFLSHPDGRGEV